MPMRLSGRASDDSNVRSIPRKRSERLRAPDDIFFLNRGVEVRQQRRIDDLRQPQRVEWGFCDM
jgi:hypothetical protein